MKITKITQGESTESDQKMFGQWEMTIKEDNENA
ncbi:MAG: hypothetical protein ACJAYB_000050 [Psychromonas sp.]|jgi:hypothetical protein